MSDIDQALSVARLQLQAERLDEVAAIHHLLAVLRPDDADGWYRLGHALAERGRDAEAAACFREVLRHAPGHAGATRELGRAVEIKVERAQLAEAEGRRVEAIGLLGAAALLGMTFVIQTFVYPGNWAEHLTWASVFAYVLTQGPGAL